MTSSTKIKLTKAQKRDLIAAYRSPIGEAYGLAYGPMVALTQTYRLAHEIYLPRALGFHIRINKAGCAVVAELLGTAKDAGTAR